MRSARMNEIAERGLAAHYKYKEGSTSNEDRFDKWFQQIRDVMSTQDTDSVDFLNDFKTSFLVEEIYVYTPRGDVKMLPLGSSALDFAFSIHSRLAMNADINHDRILFKILAPEHFRTTGRHNHEIRTVSVNA